MKQEYALVAERECDAHTPDDEHFRSSSKGCGPCFSRRLLMVLCTLVVLPSLGFLLNFRRYCLETRVAASYKRREIRELPETELLSLASAMWTLKRTHGTTGRIRYGKYFKSYDEFVQEHWDDVVALRCGDESLHGGSALFGIYHSLLTEEFDNALRSVDSSSSIAYWDWPKDLRPELRSQKQDQSNATEDSSNTSFHIKLPPFFGHANGPLNSGIFSGWKLGPGNAGHRSGEGLLRNSRITGKALTRFGAFCGLNITLSKLDAVSCSSKESFSDWSLCSSKLHNELHRAIGGAIDCPNDKPNDEESLKNGMVDNGAVGDFESALSSVNDPIFFFLHAYFDRSMRLWAARQTQNLARKHSLSLDAARKVVWKRAFDALQNALVRCHVHGRWDHHKYAPILFREKPFIRRFEKPKATYR